MHLEFQHLGANVRCFRRLSELSQTDLARRTRGALSQRQISDLERGLRPSEAGVVATLADALGVSREMLLREPQIVRDVSEARAVMLVTA